LAEGVGCANAQKRTFALDLINGHQCLMVGHELLGSAGLVRRFPQPTAKHRLATPVNWKPGDDVIIAGSVSNDEAKRLYPLGWNEPRPYIRNRAATRHDLNLRGEGGNELASPPP
jgi:hypothetical protein